MDYSAKNFRKELAATGTFYTDRKLAELIRNEIGETREVYDPTCGNGNLLAVFPYECRKYGQELRAEQLREAEVRLPNFTGVAGDTLKEPAFMDRKFQAVAANPPFSVKWEPVTDIRFANAPCLAPPSKADWAFILHCWHILADGGTAAILCFPGALYRGQREGKIREWLVRQNAVSKVIAIEGGYFEDTNISTALLVLKKGRRETTTLMVDHLTGLHKEVTTAEIEAGNFNLSVSSYVEPPRPHTPPVDPWQLQTDARKDMCQRLRKDLDFDKTVCMLEGWDIATFLDELAAIIEEYR